MPDVPRIPIENYTFGAVEAAVRTFCAAHADQLWWLNDAVMETVEAVAGLADAYGVEGVAAQQEHTRGVKVRLAQQQEEQEQDTSGSSSSKSGGGDVVGAGGHGGSSGGGSGSAGNSSSGGGGGSGRRGGAGLLTGVPLLPPSPLLIPQLTPSCGPLFEPYFKRAPPPASGAPTHPRSTPGTAAGGGDITAGVLAALAGHVGIEGRDAALPPPSPDFLRLLLSTEGGGRGAAPLPAPIPPPALSSSAASSPPLDPRIEVGGWDLSLGFGSFHHEYRLDGVLIAVAVLDILPTRVCSIYFFYNPSLRYMELGKLSALVEIWLTQQIYAHTLAHPSVLGLPPGVGPICRHWDANFYVHAVSTMNYKRQYAPSQLLCPVTRHAHWVNLTPDVLVKLDADLAAPLATVEVVAAAPSPPRRQRRRPSGSRTGGGEEDAGAVGAFVSPEGSTASLEGEEEEEGEDRASVDWVGVAADVVSENAPHSHSNGGSGATVTLTSDPAAVRAYAAELDAHDAVRAASALPATLISLRDFTEMVPYAGLSGSSKALLDRGMQHFLRRTGGIGARAVIDPLGVASVESRYKHHVEQKAAREREAAELQRQRVEAAAARAAAVAAASENAAAPLPSSDGDPLPLTGDDTGAADNGGEASITQGGAAMEEER